MAKVFVIHGMGKHDAGWWNGANEKLGEFDKIKKLKRFDKIEDHNGTLNSLLNNCSWHELLYDEQCRRLREATNNDDLFDKLIADVGGNQAAIDQLTLLKADSKDLSDQWDIFEQADFLNTHIWDVFLCANKLTRHYLALHLAKQILEEMDGHWTTNWSILAHSLGTALIQDTLNFLYQKLASDDFIRPPTVVCLLANFSRTKAGPILVSNNPISIETSVWPSNSHRKSMCKYYISARHKFDPLSYLADEMPKEWAPFPNGFARSCYRVFEHPELNHVPKIGPKSLDFSDNKNIVELGSFIHSIENYFAHPRIHLPFIYRTLARGRDVTEAHEKFATNAFLKKRMIPNLNFGDLIVNGDISSNLKWANVLSEAWKKYL